MRHLRELVMVGRLPESWIPPEQLLDLRARVRLRHTLVDVRREWQQRMQAVLYHHGVPSRRWLMTAEPRAWIARLALRTAAREQLTITLAMIDAHEAQLVPLDEELRNYAKRQPRLPGAGAPLTASDRSPPSRSSPSSATRGALAPRASPSALGTISSASDITDTSEAKQQASKRKGMTAAPAG